MKQFYQNKTILITGAASGIGKRFAEKVAELADCTLILWDRNPEDLQIVEQNIGDQATVFITGLDVTDCDRVRLEAERLIKQNLLPDIIINCAGIVIGKYYHEHTFIEIDQTLQINVTGGMWVVRVFLNEMIDRGSGHIVNLASASGFIGNPKMSVYAASKWAILGWTESLRIEMEKLKTGIRITAVIPSYINTGMFDGVKAPVMVPILETDTVIDKMLAGIANGKRTIKAPFMVRFVPLLKATLPSSAFDWLAGNVLGVYKSMDTFQGRKPKSS